MNRFEWASLSLQILTLACASYFAFSQNLINIRQTSLEDYVSVSAVPDGGGVKFLNTGGSNVYIHSLEVDGVQTNYERPRQIAAHTDDASSYYIPVPFETANKKDFLIRLEITDEFGMRWISEHGGGATDEDPATGYFGVWTYRTEKQGT